MDEGQGAVETADSPAAAASTATTTPPGAQNPGNGQPAQEPPFHQHPRWIERQREIEALRGHVGQRDQHIQQLTQRLQALEGRAQGPARTAEEAFQRQQAHQALEDLLKDHPSLKSLVDLAKAAPHLIQGYQGVESLSAQQQQQQVREARSHIAGLAKEAGLSTDDKYLGKLYRLVAMEAQSLPDGNERFERGDLTVLNEAFKTITDDFLGQTRRQAATTVLDTKNKTRQLPPVPRGGGPAEDAPPKLEPGKEREYERGLANQAKALLTKLRPSG